MSNDRLSLLSTFSVNNEFSEDDARFLHVTVDVLHTGENLNKSFFSKEVVDECVESIKNVPILGFIKRDKYTNEDDFAGHEYILKRTENGVEEKYAGRCYGVVPESCNPRWTTKVCDDGQEREFLQVDAIMWEKFTDAIIEAVNAQDRPIVYLLWGSPAQRKIPMLTNPKHLILKAPHPSPLSAYRGFFGCRHFSQTNDFLVSHGLTPIDWQIENI